MNREGTQNAPCPVPDRSTGRPLVEDHVPRRRAVSQLMALSTGLEDVPIPNCFRDGFAVARRLKVMRAQTEILKLRLHETT